MNAIRVGISNRVDRDIGVGRVKMKASVGYEQIFLEDFTFFHIYIPWTDSSSRFVRLSVCTF